MKRYAVIKNDKVNNIAIWDGKSEWNPEADSLVDITDMPTIKIGDLYEKGVFTPVVIEYNEKE